MGLDDVIITAGFVNLGDVNSHLLAFEQSVGQDSAPAPALATTMMVFMVQGLLSPLSFPYVQFPCHKVTGQLLFAPFWQAIKRLETLGLKVQTHMRGDPLIYKKFYNCRFLG